MYKHIEMRGDDPRRAVVEGTNANAHLVANLALIDGVDASIEQYSIARDKVLAAIKFYLDNQEEIDRLTDEVFKNAPTREETFARIKAKADAWRKQQAAQKEEQ